jgi:hypothetical protein
VKVRLHLPGPGIAVLVTVAIGILLVLLALDVRTWQTTVSRDDMRFRALPAHRSLWRPQTLLPGDPARRLLGAGDTMAYRRALQLFWFSRIGRNSQVQEDLPTLRAEAQDALSSEIASGQTAVERGAAANLLGVIVVTSPTGSNDPNALVKVLRRAAGYFQRATALDPSNVDAEQNLELVLRLRRPGKGRFGRDARSGYGFGRGRGAGLIGSGY